MVVEGAEEGPIPDSTGVLLVVKGGVQSRSLFQIPSSFFLNFQMDPSSLRLKLSSMPASLASLFSL